MRCSRKLPPQRRVCSCGAYQGSEHVSWHFGVPVTLRFTLLFCLCAFGSCAGSGPSRPGRDGRWRPTIDRHATPERCKGKYDQPSGALAPKAGHEAPLPAHSGFSEFDGANSPGAPRAVPMSHKPPLTVQPPTATVCATSASNQSYQISRFSQQMTSSVASNQAA